MKFLFDHDVPDDTAYGLSGLGHEVFKLRELSDPRITDEEVLRLAAKHDYILINCNRDDFLAEAQKISHSGLIILVRRRARISERIALLRLLDSAGEEGIRGNINLA